MCMRPLDLDWTYMVVLTGTLFYFSLKIHVELVTMSHCLLLFELFNHLQFHKQV